MFTHMFQVMVSWGPSTDGLEVSIGVRGMQVCQGLPNQG